MFEHVDADIPKQSYAILRCRIPVRLMARIEKRLSAQYTKTL